MAAMELMSSRKMPSSRIALFQLILLCYLGFHGVEGQCTLPDDLRGTWVDSVKGTLEFDNHTITGYDIFTFGDFTLTCYNQNGSTYIMESNSFFFFSLNFTGYFCWSFTKVNDDLYYFYEHTEKLKDAGYEKVKMYLPVTTPVYNDICYDTDPGLGTYRLLYRNSTLSTTLAKSSCPSMLQKFFTYDMTVGGVDLCSGSASFDGCTSTSSFAVSADNCTTTLGYSADGSVSCLVDIVSGDLTYMSLVNNDATVDDNSTFSFTCLIIDRSSSPYQAVQYPTQCPDDMNATSVFAPGAYVTMTLSGDCPTTTTSYLWVIGVVLVILLLIGVVVFVVLYRKKKQDDELKRKLDLQRAEDDTRYTEDDRTNTRGKYPPSVTIAIMEGRSRGAKDLRTDEGEKEKSSSFRTTGDVTPSGIQPSYDGPHRKFSKRRRVWVIGDDGSVVKEYKEPKGGKGGKGGKDSPDDSGVEDEEEAGAGDKSKTKTKSAIKFAPAAQDKEKEQKDFQKQYGRQDVKAAGELTDRGDMNSNSSKLFSKIKRMAGLKSFAMARKKRGQGSKGKSAKMYKHKAEGGEGECDGEEAAGHSSDSSHSDAGNSNNTTRVIDLRAQRSAASSSSAAKGKDGGKKSDKGRDSPDSGTGRDSALSSNSSHSSSSSSTSAKNNDRPGGGDRPGEGGVGGGSAGGRGDGGGDGGDGRGGSSRTEHNRGGDSGKGKPSSSNSSKGGRSGGGGPSDSVDGTAAASDVRSSDRRYRGSAAQGGSRVSRSRSDRSGMMSRQDQRDGATFPSRSSGFGSPEDGEFVLRDIPEDRFGAAPKGGKSGGGGGGGHVAGSGSAEDAHYGAGRPDSVVMVTPREDGGKDRSRAEGGGSNGKGKRQSTVRRKREDSTISAIDINNTLGTPVESGRPPTGHQRRHGWQDDDSSRSRSRSRSRERRQEGEREGEDKDPAPSERTESRSVRWQEEDGAKPGTADSGRRSVRWKDGSSEGDSVMVPVTSGMGIRRYPDSESGASTPSRDNRAYNSLSRLARIHKKKKAVAPILEDPTVSGGARQMVQRPPDMDDLEWKRLLEELYPDKKYLDYAKATSETRTEEEAFVHAKAGQGLSYLYDRARYWQTQEPLVRPGTSMSLRSLDSRAPSALPPPTRGNSRAGV